MSSRISFTPVEIQVVYGECEHVFVKTQVIPIQVFGSETTEKRKSTSSRSSRRSSWRSFLCSAAEQVELSDNEADKGDLDFSCKGIPLVDNIPGLCQGCQDRQARLNAQQQEREREIIRCQIAQEQDEERRRQRLAYRHMEDRRTKFRCNKCIMEGHDPVDRSANEGFCCEFGRSFWHASPECSLPPAPQRGSSRKGTSFSVQVPPGGLKHMTIGTAAARQAATQAANSYGWEQSQPEECNRIPPELVSQFISVPGNHLSSLPRPPVPSYLDGGIDINRWDNQVRTNHGTYPAPNKPLPLPPQKMAIKTRALPRHAPVRYESWKEAPASRRDSEVSKVSSMTSPRDSMGDASPVSPISSRWPSNAHRPKTRERAAKVEREMSRLEVEVDNELECWQQQM
ncbi:hypothetical protein DSL72_002240 [Monilinia vaccinii-corymbosi]|uniref:Uncharacterized protein n=1 Tax=Monilinia vaccinii-corymbosi TaxID=61207 RepID=A0A8A3PC37_9HELO|nr:hypothetical protein DSL72_002240 [Monilinia vaccinii-corymbosi]